MSRATFVRVSYLAVVLPASAIGASLGTVAWALAANVSLVERHALSFPLFLSLLLVLLFSSLLAWTVGGWFWSRLAKRFLGVTRDEMATLLISETYKAGFIDRANRRAIARLYEERNEG